MNETQRRYSGAALSKLETLARFKKFLLQELPFQKANPNDFSNFNIEDALHDIDGFSAELSGFVADMKNMASKEAIEDAFDEISERLDALMEELEGKFG